MRRLTVPLSLLLLAAPARAQERVPDDEARALAKLITVAAAKKITPPLAIAPDTDKPFAKRKDEYGALFLPDKRLTAERLRGAGKELVPVAILWTHQLVPVAGDKRLPVEKLQKFSVKVKEEERMLFVCFLAARKGPKGEPELVLLSKDRTPLLTLPLQKAGQKQKLPVEYLVSVEGDDRAHLTLQLLGEYRARLTLGVQAE